MKLLQSIRGLEPLYFVTLGFVLCLIGAFTNKTQEVHDYSVALISGGLSAYVSGGITSSKINPIDAIDSIPMNNHPNNNNNENIPFIVVENQ